MKSEKMYKSVSDDKNGKERIKCNGNKSHISVFKVCVGFKGVFSISKESGNWLQNKCYSRSNKIMHVWESYKYPHEEEV